MNSPATIRDPHTDALLTPANAALLIIDVQYRSMGETPKPILESMKEYGTSCGEAGWKAKWKRT